MEEVITVLRVTNPFDRLAREFEVVPYSDIPLSKIKELNFSPDIAVITSVNGQVVPDEFLSISYLRPNDCIMFLPVIEGGDVLRVIAFIAIAALAIYTGGTAAALMGETIWATIDSDLLYAAAVSLTFAATAMVVMYLGGMLINALLPLSAAATATSNANKTSTYSWSPAVTQQQGLSIPKMYGLFQVKGNIISTYTEPKGEILAGQTSTETQQASTAAFIDVLLAISQGPIKRLFDFRLSDQQINPQGITAYTSGTNTTIQASGLAANVVFDVMSYTRNGYLNQAYVPNFSSTKVEYDMSVQIRNVDGAFTYTTVDDNFDHIEVDVTFPKGLYTMSNDGSLKNRTSYFSVEFQKVGDSIWTSLTGTNIPASIHTNGGYWSLGYYISTYQYNPITGVSTSVKLWMEFKLGSTRLTQYKEGDWESATITLGDGSTTIINGYWHYLPLGTSILTQASSYAYDTRTYAVSQSLTFTYRNTGNLIHGKYNVRVTKVSADDNSVLIGEQINLTAVREVIDNTFTYPRIALAGLRAAATSFLSGTFDFSCVCEGSLIRVYRADEVVWNNMNYRCILAHTASLSNAPPNTTYWQQIGGSAVCSFDPFTYSDLITYVVVGDEVIGPTNGLNYTCTTSCKGSPPPSANWSQTGTNALNNSKTWAATKIYSATPSWRIEYSDNPAWVCFDILTQPVLADQSIVYVLSGSTYSIYRCRIDHTSSSANSPTGTYGTTYWEKLRDSDWAEGYSAWASSQSYVSLYVDRYECFDPSRIILSSFQTWADFCDAYVNNEVGSLERRITFNGGFDTQKNLWDTVLSLCAMGRAIPVWTGYDISVIVDQAASASYMFTSGNIIQNSFSEKFLSVSERSGQIQVQFVNRDNNYEMDTVSYFEPTLSLSSENQVSLQVIGVTKASEAWRLGYYQVLKNLYNNRVITFEVDIDALRCTVGDVIKFQHDVPQWGICGGRVGGSLPNGASCATANTVTLDQQVTLAAGKTYSVAVKLYDDTLIIKTITDPAGTYDRVSISGVFTTIPHQYDVYAVGELNIETKPFRIIGISRTGDQIVTVTAVEYYDAVYNVDSATPPVPAINYSSLTTIQMVTGLTLAEQTKVTESGSIVRSILCSFTIGNNPLFEKADIYYRVTGQTGWIKAGETLYNSYLIDNVKPLTSYDVAVISIAYDGTKTNLNGFTPVSMTTGSGTGAASLPSVTGLQLFDQGLSTTFYNKDIKFSWNATTNNIDTTTGAGSETAGAGTNIPNVYDLGYLVQIYDGSGNLRRTVSINNDHTFTYSLSMNVEDGNGTPTSTIQIKVWARDKLGNTSASAASLTVSNSGPDNVGTISAYPYEDGVTFEWPVLSTTDDIRGYVVQTQVVNPLGISGDWSTPLEIVKNTYSRDLTANEKVIQGWDNSSININIWVIDVFGQLSSVVSNASGVCKNQKPYITVGMTTVVATYNDLQVAINKLPSGGGSLILKNGIYNAPAGGFVYPDKYLNMEGESKGGVIIKPMKGDKGFTLSGLTHSIRFAHITFQTQTPGGTNDSSQMISLDTGGVSNVGGKFLIDDIDFLLSDKGVAGSQYGDYGLYFVTNGSGSVKATNCYFYKGRSAVMTSSPYNIELITNTFDSQQEEAASLSGGAVLIERNIMVDFEYRGFAIFVATDIKMAGNSITTGSAANIIGVPVGIFVNVDTSYNFVVIGNTIKMAPTVGTANPIGIFIYSILSNSYIINGVLNGNTIDINTISDEDVYGIRILNFVQGSIIGNAIRLKDTDVTGTHYGLSMNTCHRNTVTGNVIDLIQNNAKDYGIVLDYCENNKGTDNITYNVGTSVSDTNGTANVVTAKDV